MSIGFPRRLKASSLRKVNDFLLESLLKYVSVLQTPKFTGLERGKIGDEPKQLEQKMEESKEENDYFLEAETEDYKLLKPVFFSNSIYSDPSEFRFWNI